MKRRHSTEADPEEESLNSGESLAREVSCYASIWKTKLLTYVKAKRPKLLTSVKAERLKLGFVFKSSQTSVIAYEKMVLQYRMYLIKSMVDMVQQAKKSKELDEVDRQHIEAMDEYIASYRMHVRV
ncbi:hypothetical protein DM02DRAFT_342711 [Periconia macrospinosa]|uniref:Uncharacterized protein n=1 Tax=Periconia macrospinosa TaxID=97972 RepID=A0A2V1D079_9PLEO|nr:hypothetical protein DM02DRAFT_342711 [Periconia macrospinosa]